LLFVDVYKLIHHIVSRIGTCICAISEGVGHANPSPLDLNTEEDIVMEEDLGWEDVIGDGDQVGSDDEGVMRGMAQNEQGDSDSKSDDGEMEGVNEAEADDSDLGPDDGEGDEEDDDYDYASWYKDVVQILWTLLYLCALQYLSVKFELVLERHPYTLIFDTPFAEVAEFFYDHYKALNKF